MQLLKKTYSDLYFKNLSDQKLKVCYLFVGAFDAGVGCVHKMYDEKECVHRVITIKL